MAPIPRLALDLRPQRQRDAGDALRVLPDDDRSLHPALAARLAGMAIPAMTRPTQSPAACVHLRLKVEVDEHRTESGIWCHLHRTYVVCGRQGSCVMCDDFDEALAPPDVPWPGETA